MGLLGRRPRAIPIGATVEEGESKRPRSTKGGWERWAVALKNHPLISSSQGPPFLVAIAIRFSTCIWALPTTAVPTYTTERQGMTRDEGLRRRATNGPAADRGGRLREAARVRTATVSPAQQQQAQLQQEEAVQGADTPAAPGSASTSKALRGAPDRLDAGG